MGYLWLKALHPTAVITWSGGMLMVAIMLSASGPRHNLDLLERVGIMTFAGDLPVGASVRLMKANFNRLVDGAIAAAEDNLLQLRGRAPELAILISCIGRKLVLQQRIEEETEGVAEVLGHATRLAGFYSYGEIAPHSALTRCELHNQTMTVTTFSED